MAVALLIGLLLIAEAINPEAQVELSTCATLLTYCLAVDILNIIKQWKSE